MATETIAKRAAEILLDIEAVHFNTAEPYKLTSGWVSPVYIDCRKIIAFLKERRDIIDMACDVLKEGCSVDDIDYIAGGETAGIPYGAWLSETLDKPMLYVRKKPKGFGRNAQIEGSFDEGARVLLVEDLTTDGGSKILFVDVLREAGAEVTDVFSVFFYNIYKESAQIFGDAGLKLHYLTTWKDVLAAARTRGIVTEEVFKEVETFLNAPAEWSRDHGGVFERKQKMG